MPVGRVDGVAVVQRSRKIKIKTTGAGAGGARG